MKSVGCAVFGWMCLVVCPYVAAAQASAESPVLSMLTSCHGQMRERHPAATAIQRCLTQAATLLRDAITETRTSQPTAACPSPAPDLLKNRVDAPVALACILRAAEQLATTLDEYARSPEPHTAADAFVQRVMQLRQSIAAYKSLADPHVTVVSQGGISLGSWQAGVLYVLTEYLKAARPGQSPLTTVTGASAGAINGLIAASASCETRNPQPSDSLFYKTWVPLGLVRRHDQPGLLPIGTRANRHGVFTAESLAKMLERARRHLAEAVYTRAQCGVDYGFAVTHLTQHTVPVHVDESGRALVTANSLREKFALRLDFGAGFASERSTGRTALRATNLEPPASLPTLFEQRDKTGARPLARLGDSRYTNAIRIDTVLNAVRASGAFPGAFPPVFLPYQPVRLDGSFGELQTGEFVDGGVFDNAPFSLAVDLDTWQRVKRPANRVAATLLDDLMPVESRTYILVDPNVVDFTLGNPREHASSQENQAGIVSTYLGFTQRMLSASMDAAMIDASNRFPFMQATDRTSLKPVLTMPHRHLPVTGAQLGHFMAFLEHDFREIDFYLGMADAVEFVRSEPRMRGLAADEKALGASGYWRELANSERFQCVLDFYASKLGTATRIQAKALPDSCQALTRERANETKDKREEETKAYFEALEKPGSGVANQRGRELVENRNFVALLVAMHNYAVWLQSSGLTGYHADRELEMFFKELEAAEFHFVDVALLSGAKSPQTMSYETARPVLRKIVQLGLDALADEQPNFVERISIAVIGRAAADQLIAPSRPKWSLGFGIALNGLEATVGFGPCNWLRFDLGARVYRFRSRHVTAHDRVFAFDSTLALDAMFVFPFPWWSALDIEFGGGGALDQTIAAERAALAGTRIGPRGVGGLVLLQRLYLRATAEYFPYHERPAVFDSPAIPLTDNFEMSVSLGIRFLW